jgi:hypothetical protein
MNHLLNKVTGFQQIDTYTLIVEFEDETQQTINFEEVLGGHYFDPLRDPALFRQVRLDPEIHTLVWPNDAAFDPATLYNWHRGDGVEFAARVKSWQQRNAQATIRP